MRQVASHLDDHQRSRTTLSLTRTALVETYPQSEYIYGRWDTIFGAWKRTTEGITEFVPNFAFEHVRPFGQCVEAEFWYGTPGRRVRIDKILEDYQDLFSLDVFDFPDPEGSPDEVSAYLELMPQRFQQSTAALAQSSWLGLEACWFFEAFSDWLMERRWHGRFASLMWLLGGAASLSRHQRRLFHERIYRDDPLSLLADFLTASEATSCIKLLKKLIGGALDRSDASALCALVRSPQKIRTLWYLSDIKVESLRTLAALPTWLSRPKAIAGVLNGGSAASAFLKRIRKHPLLDTTVQTSIAKQMEAVRGRSDIEDMTERWERRLAAAAPFPRPPVLLPQPFEPIDTFRKLQHEGRRMNNCCVEYFAKILAGKSYFYHWGGLVPATVRLRRGSTGQWVPVDISGFGNAALSPAFIEVIRQMVTRVA
ncbi:MAG: hypothetical protein LCH56_13610 [Proteobacteria bacterium]|nr:hypothetical protein [Pseudomonadota bacterium]